MPFFACLSQSGALPGSLRAADPNFAAEIMQVILVGSRPSARIRRAPAPARP
jgi:hypothetical protein